MGQRTEQIRKLINSPEGKNIITFLVFLVISAVLWIVMALNEESQRDLRCTITIKHVPDSVVRVTPMPDYFNVSIRSRGTALIKYIFSKHIDMDIDYRNFVSHGCIKFNDVALKAFFRSRIDANAQILSVSPDSMRIYFTTNKGVKVPVKVDAHVVPGPQYAINGKVHALTDTVTLYAINPADTRVKSVQTAPIVLNGVKRPQTLRVPILVPANVRAIPDSVDVHIDVEPLVAKTRMVRVTPANVPLGYRMITSPNDVEVYYMVPMSTYKSADSNPNFSVRADFAAVPPGSNRVPVTLASAPKDFFNVFIDVDSVEFILEKKE